MESVHWLLVRYCELMDAADWDGVGELFADGAICREDGTELARGREAVAAFYRKGTRLYNGSPRTKHLVLNVVVEPQDDGTIVARSSFLVLQALDDLPLQPIITGRYVDRIRDDRFIERRFIVDLVGDLSRHLTYDITERSSSGTG
jgi:3-phenylpropionate/cinnamic acid dioxygenase small subunit